MTCLTQPLTLSPSCIASKEPDPFSKKRRELDTTEQLPLPHEIFVRIFSHLSPKNVVTCSEVSRQWHLCATDSSLWRLLFDRTFLREASHSESTDYREVYKYRHRLHSNLISGVYAYGCFQNGGGGVTSFAIEDGVLYLATSECELKVWDATTGKQIKTLENPDTEIRSLVVGDGILYACCEDGDIAIWDIKTGKRIPSFYGIDLSLNAQIRSLAIVNGILYAGSSERTIKAWDVKTGVCIHTFQGHYGIITCLLVVDGILYSGSGDCTVKAWDLQTNQCVNTFVAHGGGLSCLIVSEGKLYVGIGRVIKAFDIKTGKYISTFRNNTEVTSLAIADGILYSGSCENCTLKAWDLKTGACLNTFTGHNSELSSLIVVDGILYSTWDDKIKTWNFNVTQDKLFKEIAE